MTCVPWDKAKFYESTTAAKLNFIENAEAEKYVQNRKICNLCPILF